MKHPLRASVAVLAAAAVVVASVLITTSGSNAAANPLIGWAGSWGAGLIGPSPINTGGSLTGFSDESIRMIVHTSIGGDRLRLHFSNEFGTGPITIGHATVALPSDGPGGSADLVAGSIHELTFDGGSASTTMYAGADVVTDPLTWHVAPDTSLAVTFYLPTATGPATWHPGAGEYTFVYNGDQADNTSGAGNILTRFAFYFLAGIDVQTILPAGAIVVLGDSISNGNGATLNANTRWPDLLSARIQGTKSVLLKEGILNESIAGNTATTDGSQTGLSSETFGRSGNSRLATDVFAQQNVRTVIVELGVDDITLYGQTAPQIIEALTQLALKLKEHNINAVINTLSPATGFAAPPWTTDMETTRLAVNAWIRSQTVFDYVIDQDAVLRDPANPSQLLPAYDFGDHIHPNDAGAQALVNSITLSRL